MYHPPMLQLQHSPPQTIAEPSQRKTPRYTGEILLRTRPKTYRKVVELLSCGVSVNAIIRDCRVSHQMVEAIRTRQAATITERKQELVTMLTDVAHIGSARVMDKIGSASVRDASIGTGVAIDKVLALTGAVAPTVGVVVMPSEPDRAERRALHDKLDAIAAKLNQ